MKTMNNIKKVLSLTLTAGMMLSVMSSTEDITNAKAEEIHGTGAILDIPSQPEDENNNSDGEKKKVEYIGTFEELLAKDNNELNSSEGYIHDLYKRKLEEVLREDTIRIRFPDNCYRDAKEGERGSITINGREIVLDTKKASEYLEIPEKYLKIGSPNRDREIVEYYGEGNQVIEEHLFHLINFDLSEIEYNKIYTRIRLAMKIHNQIEIDYPDSYGFYRHYSDGMKCGDTVMIPKIGDLDDSQDVDLSDMTVISQYLLKDIELNDEQEFSADVTGDGKVDVSDLALIKQYVMGEDVKLSALS